MDTNFAKPPFFWGNWYYSFNIIACYYYILMGEKFMNLLDGTIANCAAEVFERFSLEILADWIMRAQNDTTDDIFCKSDLGALLMIAHRKCPNGCWEDFLVENCLLDIEVARDYMKEYSTSSIVILNNQIADLLAGKAKDKRNIRSEKCQNSK